MGGDSFVLPRCDDNGELDDTGEDWIFASGVRGCFSSDFWECLVLSGGSFESPFAKKDIRLFCFMESDDALALGAMSRRLSFGK